MPDSALTPEDATLVHDFVDIPPGLAIDRTDVQRARLAQAAGGRFRKVAPGLYEIITHAPDNPTA
ncbi:hypothetical protein OG689_39115 [Kitasatospora sp. NBC_00240]|uniref:hypothetical protein n=1 Tax=Kitasatospora sp. NBC_00240 TaxID=2903567 RepID=UPI00224E61EB|nr:hypothetical protein [Kitasatospora sp. NBC_00240]MCX5215206.1 hypothetical protein [Kitasatospora sp. NBC_00240]